jgi:hypothetical protein
MPDWTFKSYGAQNDDGVMDTTEQIALQMQQSAWIFMVKSGADGYGHILHDAFACGVPVIINYSEYKDKIGGRLLIPDETCLVLETGGDFRKVAEKIQNMPPHQYQWMRQRVREKFDEVVNFEKEADDIKLWLDKLR